MRLLDNAKDLAGKAQGYVADHSDQVKGGIDKAGSLANRATRGKFSGTIDSLGRKAAQIVPTKGAKG